MNTPNKELQFSAKDVKNMVDAIDGLFEKTRVLFNANQFSQHPESIAEKEKNEYPEQMETTFSIATISMESASDHLAAFSDLLKAPAKPLAAYTCVRSLIEMSSLACWLLDPDINSKERIGRTFAHRYSELAEQQKQYNATNDQGGLETIRKRIEKVETDALSLGFAKVLNKNRNRIGIAQQPLSIIALINTTFGHMFNIESVYRMLSGLAHGYMWAVQQAGFKLIEHDFNDGINTKGLTKELVPNIAFYFGTVALVCFARVLFSLWTIFGWDIDEIVKVLDETFDKVEYSNAPRFWRESITPK